MEFTLKLARQDGYRFSVDFDLSGVPDLLLDEPAPLGEGSGPNASRLLAAAVANCLSASLLFCLNKFKQDPHEVVARVKGHMVRNEKGRLRVGGFDVEIRLGETVERLAHCAEQFEDFCVVTDSVRHGIPVTVRVLDAGGQVVHQSAG
ncbi:MAG TPA: OsmC family protein [Gallionellaceae bacterium]|nr:OsmC family protein [Gallionellaceae bacterium]